MCQVVRVSAIQLSKIIYKNFQIIECYRQQPSKIPMDDGTIVDMKESRDMAKPTAWRKKTTLTSGMCLG